MTQQPRQKAMISQRTVEAQRFSKETTVSKQLWPPIPGTQPSPIPPILPSQQNLNFVQWQGTQSQGKNHSWVKPIPVISQPFEIDCCRSGCETQFWPKKKLVEASENVFSFSQKEGIHKEMLPASPFLLLHVFYCKREKTGMEKQRKGQGLRREKV